MRRRYKVMFGIVLCLCLCSVALTVKLERMAAKVYHTWDSCPGHDSHEEVACCPAKS